LEEFRAVREGDEISPPPSDCDRMERRRATVFRDGKARRDERGSQETGSGARTLRLPLGRKKETHK
jgi:hypothetical protein